MLEDFVILHVNSRFHPSENLEITWKNSNLCMVKSGIIMDNFSTPVCMESVELGLAGLNSLSVSVRRLVSMDEVLTF